MVIAWLILVLSAALFVFYVQVVSETILKREFDRDYFRSVVRATCLEFPAMRESLQVRGVDRDFNWFKNGLMCDYLALTYLLKRGGSAKEAPASETRLLMIYFRFVYLSLLVRHVLQLGEERTIRRLASILEYFANRVGQRMNTPFEFPVPANWRI